MVDRYQSLIKSTTLKYESDVDSLSRAYEEVNTNFLNAFSLGTISLDSPYIQSILAKNEEDRQTGLKLLREDFDANVDMIRAEERQNYINSVLDVVSSILSVGTGVGLVKGAFNRAEDLTSERRKLDPKAPDVKPQIPYEKIINRSLLPALNSASNILTRYNYRFNR